MYLNYQLEIVALVLAGIIGSFHYDPKRSNTARYWIFNKSLMFIAFTTCFDILSSMGLNNSEKVPLLLNQLLSTLYFAFLFLALAFISLYAFYLIYEHLPKQNFRYLIGFLLISTTLMEALTLTNYWTGCFFTIENGLYVRGTLTHLPYVLITSYMTIIYVVYIAHRRDAGSSMHRLMRILTASFLLMGSVTLLFPNVMMNGLMLATLELIFYINSQNTRLGQDFLTDLPNRQVFFQQLEQRRRADRKQHVILLYCENFQDLNHRFSIHATDMLIYQISRTLESIAPSYDLYRYSSTRFVLMGDFTSITRCSQLTQLILERFAEPWDIDGQSCMVHVHISHMDFNPREVADDELLDQLEFTLNVAKETGDSNSVIVFNEHYRFLYRRNLYILDEVKDAIANNRFEVYFQPIYSQQKRKFLSAEALVRLHSRDGNLLSPGDFIPLAEKHHLINDISWIVIEKTLQFLHYNPELELDNISINISSELITDISFLSRFRSLMTQYQIPNRKVKLEVTERTISDNPGIVKSVMLQLDSEGIRFSLDDFGTGYSNFEALLSYPFQTVKLDRSIMKNIDIDDRYRRMIHLMVETITLSNMNVVAEGLEKESQIQESRHMNIDYVQGFYYAKPMPSAELPSFLGTKIVHMGGSSRQLHA